MMEDIPPDVMARAVELCWLKSPSPLRDQVADHLARAILQERERCAQIADEHRARIEDHHPDKPSHDLVALGYGNAALNIAAAIRSTRP